MTNARFQRQQNNEPVSAAQAVADLHWVVTSPSLVDHRDAISAQPLAIDQVDGDHLARFLAARSGYRVGRYFEALVAYWLEHVVGVEMIGHGVQIKDGKRTIGEVDFLFRDADGHVNHWEVAVKFFLHCPNDQPLENRRSDFPGPNASDNFELKTQKLFESQLPISRKHFPEVSVRRGLVRGTIFYHPAIEPPEHLPAKMADGHHRGRWLRQSELSGLETFESSVGAIAHKPLWLSPPLNSEPRPLSDLNSELRLHFESASSHPSYPVMVCIMDAAGLHELERVFVVPNDWPSRAD